MIERINFATYYHAANKDTGRLVEMLSKKVNELIDAHNALVDVALVELGGDVETLQQKEIKFDDWFQDEFGMTFDEYFQLKVKNDE